MQETYRQMKDRHQKEVNALPIMFAFSEKQFEEGMRKLGLEPTDTDKIYAIRSAGGFYRREDSDNIVGTFERHAKEKEEAMKDEDFAVSAFRYELGNYEYCISYDDSEAIMATGLTRKEVANSEMLMRALERAKQEYLESCDW